MPVTWKGRALCVRACARVCVCVGGGINCSMNSVENELHS